MKYLGLSVLLFLLVSCGKRNETATFNLDKDNDKFSYSLGLDLADNISKQERFDTIINNDALIEGLKDYMKDSASTKLTIDSAREYLIYFMMPEEVKKTAEENLAASMAFIAKAKEEGFSETESGLLYKVIEESEGAKPTPQDIVKVKYTGKLANGEVFDSSEKDEEGTRVFQVSAVIKGWQEGLSMMNVGSKYHFIIPPKLGYGNNWQRSPGGPSQALDFDVELVEIVDKAELQKQMQAAQSKAK